MGYAPYGVQGDSDRMSERKQKLMEIREYLMEHPEIKKYKDYTLKKVKEEIASLETFEFLS